MFLCVSITLVYTDLHSALVQHYRPYLAVLVQPIRYLVDTPIKLVHALSDNMSTRQQLLRENAQLRAHQLALEAKLQRLLALRRENVALRELLQSSARIHGRILEARLLAVDLSPGLHQLVLNRGQAQQVYVGQPVLDAYGVMGQVVQVEPLLSQVMLLTDEHSAIPVQAARNGLRGVIVGRGQLDQLQLLHVPDTTDVKVGDLFVTSGLGQHFPVGYPVARVTRVQHDPGQTFAKVILKPVAHLNRTNRALLVWPSDVTLARSVEKLVKKRVLA